MKTRTVLSLIALIYLAFGEYSLGYMLEANMFLVGALVVLGLSRK